MPDCPFCAIVADEAPAGSPRPLRRRSTRTGNLLPANGEAAGQEVFHAHVYVLPRYADDGVTVEWPQGT